MSNAYLSYLRAYSLIIGGGSICLQDVATGGAKFGGSDLLAIAIGAAHGRQSLGDSRHSKGPYSAEEFEVESANRYSVQPGALLD